MSEEWRPRTPDEISAIMYKLSDLYRLTEEDSDLEEIIDAAYERMKAVRERRKGR